VLSQVGKKVYLRLPQIRKTYKMTFVPGLVVTLWRAAAQSPFAAARPVAYAAQTASCGVP